MKFSSSANIALASIALSSPNLLSSPVFANAAPTRDTGTLSPNLGAGYFGTSPQLHATESPVMPAMPSPPTSKIAGRRRSLRRSRAIKHRRGENAARNIDPLGLGTSAGDIQSEAESILHPRVPPTASLSGIQGIVDPFSPIIGSGGLLTSTGLVPPNTPMLGGVPLSDGVDPSVLLGAIPAVPMPGVDNVIPIIQNSVSSGAPGAILSSLAASPLPHLDGLSPTLGGVPVAIPQFPPGLTPGLGNLSPVSGGIPSLAGGLSTVQGVASGVVPQVSNALPHVPGVSQAQTGSLPVVLPNVNGLAPPTVMPNLGTLPNVVMLPTADALPAVPDPVAALPQLAGGVVHVSDAIPQISGAIPQVPGIVPQAPGGTDVVPQVPGVIPQFPADPLSKVNPSLPLPSLTGAAPVPTGSEIPLVSPAGLATPVSSLVVPRTSVIPLSSVALPTSVSSPDGLPTPLPVSNALPTLTKANPLAQPIESLAPPDPLSASNSVPRILVSSPNEIGVFEPLEGVGAGAMGRPEDDGAPTEGIRKKEGVPPMVSNQFDRPGVSGKEQGSQIISGIKSAVEPRIMSQSERPMSDRTTSGLAPTNSARPSANLDVPATAGFFTSTPTGTIAQITAVPEPPLDINEEIASVWKRQEPESPGLPRDIGAGVVHESGSSLLSEGAPVPTSSVYLPSATRLGVPSQESLHVSRSASMVTLKSFSMASVMESATPIMAPAQTVSPAIGGIGPSMDMAQPTDLIPTISDDSLSGHSSSDESPLHISPTATAVASSPVTTLYTGGVPLGRSLERSADTPSSVVAISGDSPNMPSPTSLGSGTSMNSQDKATRKIFRWGVPKMVTSTIRSVATAVKK